MFSKLSDNKEIPDASNLYCSYTINGNFIQSRKVELIMKFIYGEKGIMCVPETEEESMDNLRGLK